MNLAHGEVYLIQHYVNKPCWWPAAGLWFSLGTPVSSTNKTDCHNITEILLKVALNTITLTPNIRLAILKWTHHDQSFIKGTICFCYVRYTKETYTFLTQITHVKSCYQIGIKLEAPRSLYSSPGYNNNISQKNFITSVALVIVDPFSKKFGQGFPL